MEEFLSHAMSLKWHFDLFTYCFNYDYQISYFNKKVKKNKRKFDGIIFLFIIANSK